MQSNGYFDKRISNYFEVNLFQLKKVVPIIYHTSRFYFYSNTQITKKKKNILQQMSRADIHTIHICSSHHTHDYDLALLSSLSTDSFDQGKFLQQEPATRCNKDGNPVWETVGSSVEKVDRDIKKLMDVTNVLYSSSSKLFQKHRGAASKCYTRKRGGILKRSCSVYLFDEQGQ